MPAAGKSPIRHTRTTIPANANSKTPVQKSLRHQLQGKERVFAKAFLDAFRVPGDSDRLGQMKKRRFLECARNKHDGMLGNIEQRIFGKNLVLIILA